MLFTIKNFLKCVFFFLFFSYLSKTGKENVSIYISIFVSWAMPAVK